MSTNPDPLVKLQNAFRDKGPHCDGLRAIPPSQAHQLLLYYAQGTQCERIDLGNATEEQIESLYKACKPAPFGRGQEDVFDERYRKAWKLDLDAFSTLFNPSAIKLNDVIDEGLLTHDKRVTMELHKLNVYGKGDFFKPHKDTPRGYDMFGSLVVVFPTPHEGGQLVFRQGGKEWTVDSGKMLSAATQPSVCFIAFFSDVEHEVLPVTSGYRVTLTYNLRWAPKPDFSDVRPTITTTPFYQTLKDVLVTAVKNENILPNGGYLGFGLRHQYVFDEKNPLSSIKLKGADQVLSSICEKLGISHSLKLVYKDLRRLGINLVSDRKIALTLYFEDEFEDILWDALKDLTIDNVEGVDIVGGSPMEPEFAHTLNQPNVDEDPETEGSGRSSRKYCSPWSKVVRQFYRKPVTQLVEVEPSSSVDFETEYLAYGNEATVGYVWAHASLLVSLGSWESRQHVVL